MMSRARRLMRDALLRSGVPAAADVRRIVRAAGSPAAREVAVLVAPPGGGNIGDQAMVEAYIEATDGRVVVVASAPGSIAVPAHFGDRVVLAEAPDLLYGSGSRRRGALRDFGALLASARSVSVIGADIMDGFYNPRASVMRAVVAEASARHGAPTRVLGFSWSDHPHPAARRRLAGAARAGVALLPRDPVSARRLVADRVGFSREVADIVFTATASDVGLRERLDLRGRYAVVNISGHLNRGVKLIDDYRRIVAWLLDRGLEVVLLPHVVTESADDRIPSALVASHFAERVHLVRETPSPAEVRGITEDAVVTVTGRMHLAIMSFMFGVPAVTLASQGKVEGLMELMGTPELCVRPVPGMADIVIGLLADAIAPRSAVRQAIAAALSTVNELATENFVGLVPTKADAR